MGNFYILNNLSVSLVGMDVSVCIFPGKANCGEGERRGHYWIEWRYGKQLLVFQPSEPLEQERGGAKVTLSLLPKFVRRARADKADHLEEKATNRIQALSERTNFSRGSQFYYFDMLKEDGKDVTCALPKPKMSKVYS